nr:gliding motility-associated C-terminal domain-containing protein [Saprospiraceae bacterium]
IQAYRWNFALDDGCQEDCPARSITPLESGFFIVEVESALGCMVQDTVFVRVIDDGGLFVPNAFSPNNDGINDVLQVFGGPSIQMIDHFEVFDRWGRMVFSAKDFIPGDQNVTWDGQSGATMAKPGVYVYMLRGMNIKGEVKEFAGEVTLLR